MKDKSLWLDGVLGSQSRDTQGETLSVEGADISELTRGAGKWNDNHGRGFINTLGRITEAKKIFKAEDCENDRHKYYWDKIKTPFIYGKGYLFNDDDHMNAKACAAILRNIHRTDSPLKLKLSVEGGVVSRGLADPTLLARTKIVACAITFTPANQATLVEPLNLDKSSFNQEADMVLIKSVLHLAETNVPSFRYITRHTSAEKIENNLNKIGNMLGVEIPLDLKQSLIEESLESKIAENVVEINKLVKDAMQQRAPTAMTGPAGYTFSHEHHDLGGGQMLTNVKAHTLNGDHVGAATFSHGPKGLKLGSIVVDEDHQRKGIGSSMMNHAERQTGKKIIDSTQQTDEGAALWNNRKPLSKGLTAGYGGAGAPTSMTGGSVLQAESQELGPKNLSFITCDNCGKEQVYGKYQVKCREPNCGKAFSMAKLEDFFRVSKG